MKSNTFFKISMNGGCGKCTKIFNKTPTKTMEASSPRLLGVGHSLMGFGFSSSTLIPFALKTLIKKNYFFPCKFYTLLYTRTSSK